LADRRPHGYLAAIPERPATMDAQALFSALLMGIVEGITEFLPISSTGHLILLGELIGFTGPGSATFKIAIQLGAILAVVVVFWRTLMDLALKAWRPGPERFYAVNIILAFIPAMVIGATFYSTIHAMLFNPWIVCVALIAGGVAIIAIERWRPNATIRSVPEIGPLGALLIGFGQVLAMIPGTSRSGATIITALLLGVERRAAAEFSFLLAIPTMFAATVYALYKGRNELDLTGLAQIGVGFVTAFVVALVVVRWLMAVIARIGFTPFGWYRIALGTVMLAVLLLS
jgi:undecaprenyl-diphosphatase